jgi:hypothetical protein
MKSIWHLASMMSLSEARRVSVRYLLPDEAATRVIHIDANSDAYAAIQRINSQHGRSDINALALGPSEEPIDQNHVFRAGSTNVYHCLALLKVKFRFHIAGRKVHPVLKVIHIRRDATFDDFFEFWPREFQVLFTGVTLNGQPFPTDGPICSAIVSILGRTPDASAPCEVRIFVDETRFKAPARTPSPRGSR